MSSWYKKCMPTIRDVSPHLTLLMSDLKKADGVKGIYIWGSFSRNIDNIDHRLIDIDVLARTCFNSGDLLSINNDVINTSFCDDDLEIQGYDPLAIKFSKEFIKLSKYNIDHWAISSDRKLLHWGPTGLNQEESIEMKKEALSYANKQTGILYKKLNKTSDSERRRWYKHYYHHINKNSEGMPTGWYKTEAVKIKTLISNAIKI